MPIRNLFMGIGSSGLKALKHARFVPREIRQNGLKFAIETTEDKKTPFADQADEKLDIEVLKDAGGASNESANGWRAIYFAWAIIRAKIGDYLSQLVRFSNVFPIFSTMGGTGSGASIPIIQSLQKMARSANTHGILVFPIFKLPASQQSLHDTVNYNKQVANAYTFLRRMSAMQFIKRFESVSKEG